MLPYTIIEPRDAKVPILLSIPHCGTAFPEELKNLYKSELIEKLDDTDWFLDKLYDFAPDLGITTLVARYSRWVIDLNRSPESKALYNDGRIITELVPMTNFLGESIYTKTKPDEEEIRRRIELYYKPYHQKIEEILTNLQAEFGKVLLYDAHSIRRFVPSIHKETFPDFILGDNDEKSAHPVLIQTALKCLSESDYQISHNFPFKGGYITRSFGKPEKNRHALQLERAKLNYMDDNETYYDKAKAEKMKGLLKNMFLGLIEALGKV